MNRLSVCVLLGLIALAAAQWNNQNQFPNQQQQYPSQFPGQVQFPQYPVPGPDLCKQPGANCKVESRFAEESSVTDHRGQTTKYTRVCDDRGCYDRKVYSGSSTLTTSYILLTITAVFAISKIFFN